jgi:alpha,alpha-trehalase
VRLIRQLRASGVKTGIFSASRHAENVLRSAGVFDLFDERIDGIRAEELGLPGKPSPAVLLELTRRLESTPARTVVFEDAIAGVQAGRAGGFRLTVGVNRGAPAGSLTAQGAHIEVSDLNDVEVAK